MVRKRGLIRCLAGGRQRIVTDLKSAASVEEVEGQKRTRIVRDEVRYTTLERSVEGLTGGKPVPLPVFETRITDKIVHPVPITEPVEDGLPLENGNGSDAAN